VTWARHSLTARTLAISGVFAVLLAAAFALLVVAINSLRDAGQAAVRAQQAVTAGTELEKSVLNLENGLKGYVASGNRAQLAPFDTARKDYPRQVERLKALARDDAQLRGDVTRISGSITDYVNLWALPVLSIARDDLEIARSVIVNTRGRMRVARIRADFRTLFERARGEAAAKARRADRRSDVAVSMGVAGIILVLALTGGLAWLLRRSVLRPIRKVAGATETIAAGDLTARVPVERQDEIGDLARSFNAMAESLGISQQELAKRAAELERSNRELEDYASVTSHDLQGPLVTIGMYAELLTQRVQDPDARELAAHIRDGAASMRRLVRELLAYARLERHAGRRERVPLEEAYGEARDNLAGPIRDAGAEITVEGDLPAVTGDPARLTQLLQNLLTNAIKFTEDGDPRVEVSARPEGPGMVRVSVRDHGIGFQEGQSDVIFRPFHRLHGADRFEGTGIGLAVCQKIVDQHGGRIWAEGRPGEGATFHFTLPLAGDEAGSEREPEPAGAPRAAV
jgi:signal transduction histidine kinase